MPHNDMSRALGLSSGDKLYFGWYKEFIGGYSSSYYQFSGNVIGSLEEGSSFYDSLNYALTIATVPVKKTQKMIFGF